MSKKLKNFESYRVKQMIFVLFAVLVIALFSVAFLLRNVLQAYAIAVVLVFALLFLVSRYDYLLTLKEYERAVIFRYGKVKRVGGPGWAFLIPVIEHPTIVDLRTHTVDVPAQEIITMDKIVTKIDAVVYLYVKKDPESVINSVIEIDDYKEAAKLFVQGAIRDVAGGLVLTELISQTDKLNEKVKEGLQQIAKEWGVSVEAVEITDIKLPSTVESAMHEQKAAEQHKLARMEEAKAHQAEIEAVREAAETLSDKALSYYYIRALEKLGEGKATKLIFPMELSRLAEAIGKGSNDKEIEALLKKYAPKIKAIVK